MIFTQPTYFKVLRPLLVSGLILLGNSCLAGQTPAPVDVSIESARARTLTGGNKAIVGWSVSIAFTKGFEPAVDSAQVKKASNYKIMNANTGVQVTPSIADFVLLPNSNSVAIVKIILSGKAALNADDSFYLFATNLTFNGVKPKSTPMHEIDVPVVTQTEPTGSVPKPTWSLGSSKGKNDSDLYGSYELTKARGVATTGTGDVKVAVPFFKTFWNRTSKFSPEVDLNASSDATADPDSLKFAVEWFLPVSVKERSTGWPYTAVDLINSGKIEAPKNFNNINALWESKWLFPSSHFPWNGKKFRLSIDPFVGTELGRNLKSPLKSIEGKGLARLMAGADLTVQIKVSDLAALKGFEFDSSYIRRWPLKRELLVDKDANGNLVALALSKGPKDYSDSKFIIKVNDYFGPYIGYEWGRLPPNYELVDHKWTFGLLFKSKVKSGGQ